MTLATLALTVCDLAIGLVDEDNCVRQKPRRGDYLGFSFATVLTLVIVPVLDAVLFGARDDQVERVNADETTSAAPIRAVQEDLPNPH